MRQRNDMTQYHGDERNTPQTANATQADPWTNKLPKTRPELEVQEREYSKSNQDDRNKDNGKQNTTRKILNESEVNIRRVPKKQKHDLMWQPTTSAANTNQGPMEEGSDQEDKHGDNPSQYLMNAMLINGGSAKPEVKERHNEKRMNKDNKERAKTQVQSKYQETIQDKQAEWTNEHTDGDPRCMARMWTKPQKANNMKLKNPRKRQAKETRAIQQQLDDAEHPVNSTDKPGRGKV